MTRRAQFCLATMVIICGLTLAAGGPKPPAVPRIPVSVSFTTQPHPGVYGDAMGPYLDGLDGVEASVSSVCDHISFRTLLQNGQTLRPVIYNFAAHGIPNLGIEAGATYSYTKPQQTPCTNDLRTLQLFESRTRYTYMENVTGDFRLRWSDVTVTCTYRTAQCSQWSVVPISSAEITKASGGGKPTTISLGFYAMPFEMVLTAQ